MPPPFSERVVVNYSRARKRRRKEKLRREIIDADRLLEFAAMSSESFGEPATDGRRKYRFLGVAVEPHVGDHPAGEIVEIRKAPHVDIARNAIGAETRLGGTGERVRGRLSHRGFVVE